MEGFGELFGELGELVGGIGEFARDRRAEVGAAAAAGAMTGKNGDGNDATATFARVLAGGKRPLDVNDL